MSKKLLGDRQVGDVEYHGGTIMTDEEATATGLPASDFADVKDNADAPAEAKPTPEAKPDEEAIVDASAEQKNEDQPSEQAGNESGAGSSEPVAEAEEAKAAE